MIQFKQKDFVLPVLAALGSTAGMGALTAAGTGISAVQGHKGNKMAQEQGQKAQQEQERANREQARIAKQQQEQQAAALQKITKAAQKNPAAAGNAVQAMQASYSETPVFRQKEYGAVNLQNIKGFMTDLGTLGAKRGSAQKIVNMATTGAVMGGLAYGADKIIQHDIKKSGGELPGKVEKTPEEQKKAKNKKLLGTGLAIAGTGAALVAGKKGYLGARTQMRTNNALARVGNKINSQKLIQSGKQGWMEGAKTLKPGLSDAAANRAFDSAIKKPVNFKAGASKAGNSIKTGLKNQIFKTDPKTGEFIKNAEGKNKLAWGNIAMNAGFGLAVPLGSYYLSKSGQKQQAEQSQQQFSEQDNTQQEKKNGIKKKALIGLGTAAVAAGTFAAGRRGMLGSGMARATNNVWARAGNKLGNQNMVKSGTQGWAAAKAKTATNAKLTRLQAKGAPKLSESQVNEMMNNNKARYENLYKAKLQKGSLLGDIKKSVSKGVGKTTDVLSFGYGRSEQKEAGKILMKNAVKDANGNINPLTQKASNLLAGNKHKVLMGAAGIGMGALAMKPWTSGEKLTKKALGAVDKNAFAYENSQNQEVQ